MIVIPSIDLMKGECVRLIRGVADTRVSYGDPLKWLNLFASYKATHLQIIDLDAAIGLGDNVETVREIVKSAKEWGLVLHVGGGLRSYSRASRILDMGADRVILGTIVFRKPVEFKKIIQNYGCDRVIVALDLHEGRLAIEGWKNIVNVTLEEIAARLAELEIEYVLATNVDRDGTLVGYSPPPEIIIQNFNTIVAGGISSIIDLKKASESGAYAAVIGKAIYNGLFRLEELENMRWRMYVG